MNDLDRNRPSGKVATMPSLRVAPGLRKAAESVLAEGESLSAFMEQALRESIARRRNQRAFVERGLAHRDGARASGEYYPTETLLEDMDTILERHRSGHPSG
jgi:predicted transcriptional regulator